MVETGFVALSSCFTVVQIKVPGSKMTPPQFFFVLRSGICKILKNLPLQNYFDHMFGIFYVELPSGPLPSSFK